MSVIHVITANAGPLTFITKTTGSFLAAVGHIRPPYCRLKARPIYADLHLWLSSSNCSQEGRGHPTSVANRYHVDIIVMVVNRTRGSMTASVMQAGV